MKNYLEFIDWYYPGEKSGGPVITLHNELKNRPGDDDVTVLTRDNDIDGTKFTSESMVKFKEKISYNILYLGNNSILRGWVIIREVLRVDCVKLNGIYSPWFNFFPIILSMLLGRRVEVRPHGMLSRQTFCKRPHLKVFYLKILKMLISKDTIFLCSSDREEKDAKNFFAGCRFRIERNPTRELRLLTKEEFFRKRNIKLLYTGRISPEKQVLELLKFCSSNDLDVTVIGSNMGDDYFERCRVLFDSNIGLRYIDHLPWEQLEDFYQKSLIYITFSFGENFGQTIYEAIMSGCQVIAREDSNPWVSFPELVSTFREENEICALIQKSIQNRNYEKYVKVCQEI